MTFDDLKLAPAILKAVQGEGYTTPTPIQQQAIPAVLAGGDLLAGAQTGTGKTAAFTLPLLHRLAMSRSAQNKFGGTGVRALVLTPTRELAAQVEESIRTYGKYLQLSSTVIFGGVGMGPQINRLRAGVDILVATPGRLLDLQQQGKLDLSTVQMLVLDEADRMLDMGFIHDIKKVLALLPKEKQSLLFSATFSDEIRDLAHGLLNNPQSIQVTPRNTTVQRISQVWHLVGRGKKKALLAQIINEHNWSQVLVFTRTKFGANNVAEFLIKNGIAAMALHGNKSQGARTQALEGFKSGSIRALVATDIAARGIDIEDLPHVVNYEIPNVSEDYVHRIGRTGRAGKEGQAVSLVSLDEEGFMADIERFTKQSIPRQDIAEFAPGPDEKAEPIAMGRQTIWGGLGKPPSREVMAAAAKAARQEMMQRIREQKGSGQRSGGNGQRNGSGGGQGKSTREGGERRNAGATGSQRSHAPRAAQERAQHARPQGPRADGHPGQRNGNGQQGSQRSSQPDPLRTGVDSMSSRRGQGGYNGSYGGANSQGRSGGGNHAGGGAGNYGGGNRGQGNGGRGGSRSGNAPRRSFDR
jgi:ATP-dependent RNA helicase RhlE